MTAGKLDITIERGATFRLPLRLRDGEGGLMNLDGYSARMQVREEAESEVVLLNWTTENGGILFDTFQDALCVLRVRGPATETAAVVPDRGVYDLELENPDGDVDRLLKGRVKFDPNITR